MTTNTRTSVATDSFGSAENPLSTNWSQLNNGWGNIASAGAGTCTGSGVDAYPQNEPVARWNGTGTFNNDQYAKATIGGLAWSGSRWVGVLVRASADTNAGKDFYYFTVQDDNPSGSSHTTVVGKMVNGTGTQLATASIVWTNGDTISLEVIGTTLYMYKNDTLLTSIGTSGTVTDSALSSGKPGMFLTSLTTLASWSGGQAAIAVSDTTAPTYGANPAKTANTNTSVTLSATASDETDTAVDHYVGIYATGNTPTAANIIAGAGTGFVVGASGLNVANGVSTNFGGAITGLTGSVAYDAWATVQEHGATKNPHTPFQVAFTTAATLTSPLGAMDATTGPTGNTASGGITVTGATGTAYWYLSASATPPNATDLKAGTSSLTFGNVAISAPGAIVFANKGSLAEKTNYYFHYIVNQNSQDSAISSSAAFQATDAPTITQSGSTTVGVATAGTTATLTVSTNRAAVGTMWVVVTTSSTKPTSTQIKAGQNNAGSAAAYASSDNTVTDPQIFSATGLVASTGYFAHFYQEDAGSDGSNIYTSNSFTTPGVGTYNVDAFSANARPGGTVTVTISGAWAATGKTATINGHPVTLATQSAIQCTFVCPSLHTDPSFNDTKYNVPVQFVLTDGGFQGSKNFTVLPPSGYDFVEVVGISGIWTDDAGLAIGDDHLGHWTVGTADPISATGILSNITGYPATYVYWRFDESEAIWTASASEIFYEIVAFTGTAYTDKTYYNTVAISTFAGAGSFNASTANITAYAQIGTIPGLTLNTSTGALTGTPTTPGIYQTTIQATDSDSNTAFSNTFNVNVYGIPVWSASPGNQVWTDGDVISLMLSALTNADGLSPAVSWSKLAGTYPSGLSLNTATGEISGTLASNASQSSPYNGHQYRATNPTGNGDSAVFSMTVNPLAPTFVGPDIANISISTGAMTPVDVSAKFAVYITSYAFVGAVPTGISISSVGVISGTPTTFGTFSVHVDATNANGTVSSNQFNIIATASGPTFTGNITNKGPYALGVAITPVDVSAQFGGGAATNYLLNSAPPGLVISAAGVISGTPTGATSTGVTVTKVNDAGSAQSNVFTITIVTAAPVLTSPPLPNRNNFTSDVVAAINFNLLWTGATSVAVTNLPSGLTDTSGSVAGTVTTVQTKTVLVTATNVYGSTVASFTWVVSSTTPVLSNGAATTGGLSATLHGVTTAFSGQVKWVVTQSATPPTAAQVKLGQNNGGTAADKAGTKNITVAGNITGLTANGLVALTTYYGYIVHTLSGNDSNVLATGSFQPSGSGGSTGGSGIIRSIIQG